MRYAPRTSRIGSRIALLGLAGLGCSPGAEEPPAGEPVRYRVVVENDTSRVLSRAELWLYSPVRDTSAQELVGLEISHPHRALPGGLGNQRLYFEFEDVPVSFREEISVVARLERPETPRVVDEPSLHSFLEPLAMPESSSPLPAAEALRGDSEAEAVRNVIAWLEANAAGTGDASGDAAETTGREPALLTTALLRRAGVPARVVAGFADEGGGELEPGEYRLWSEYYLDGVWHPLPAPAEAAPGYVAMRVAGPGEALSATEGAGALYETVGLRVRFAN